MIKSICARLILLVSFAFWTPTINASDIYGAKQPNHGEEGLAQEDMPLVIFFEASPADLSTDEKGERIEIPSDPKAQNLAYDVGKKKQFPAISVKVNTFETVCSYLILGAFILSAGGAIYLIYDGNTKANEFLNNPNWALYSESKPRCDLNHNGVRDQNCDNVLSGHGSAVFEEGFGGTMCSLAAVASLVGGLAYTRVCCKLRNWCRR